MDGWSYRDILEISSVFFSYFAPVIIALVLFYLVNNIIHQVSMHNRSPSGNTLGNIVLSILAVAFLTYVEIRLIRWLTS